MNTQEKPGKAEYEAVDALYEKAKRLVERLLSYRRAAAIMIADWHITPDEGFKAALQDKHMGLLRELISGDWKEQYGYEGKNPVNGIMYTNDLSGPKGKRGRKSKFQTDAERLEARRAYQREYIARRKERDGCRDERHD